MMHSVQITIVNLDRNSVDLAQGWYVDAIDHAGALAEVLRLLSGTEHLPENPFEQGAIGGGSPIIMPGDPEWPSTADRVTTGN